jgi:hypothetical protein
MARRLARSVGPTARSGQQAMRRSALHGFADERAGPSNKRMQLTKLRAAPVLQAEVPPCARAGVMDAGTASQLIRSVLRTRGSATQASVV